MECLNEASFLVWLLAGRGGGGEGGDKHAAVDHAGVR